MSGTTDISVEQTLAITDPGEKERDLQSRADRLIIQLGNIVAWLFPILMVAICTQVVIRKLGNNQAWLDDAQWWIYGFAMTVGFFYAITTQSHVRVDILHQNFSDKKKAKIEVFGLGWLLLPFLHDHDRHSVPLWLVVGPGARRLGQPERIAPPVPVEDVPAGSLCLCRRRHDFHGAAPSWHLRARAALDGRSWPSCPQRSSFAERITYYVLYWFTLFSNPEINPRRVAREPIFEWTMWIGIAIVAILIHTELHPVAPDNRGRLSPCKSCLFSVRS